MLTASQCYKKYGAPTDEKFMVLWDRVWMALESAGFEVGDQHPYAYTPHVTLAYMPGANRPSYRGPVPHGTWNFSGIHIWGLSKPYVVEMGSFYGKNIVPFPVLPARYASLDMNIFTTSMCRVFKSMLVSCPCMNPLSRIYSVLLTPSVWVA